ncbi:flap endonuclease-1 [Candidatus Woesearchaeota archaeon]|nr:MAG: flap endonuclease-1 [Candidatus Woesearchaeota archaeon]
MGVNLKDLFEKKALSFKDLKGKVLVVDGFNMLYQFLTTIRAPDGAVFTNKDGVVTSHLIGLFSRTTKFLLEGLKLVFVFDGVPPVLKQQELERRFAVKKDAAAAFEKAKSEEDVLGMKKFAGRTAKLTDDMVSQAKLLLDALGVPWVQAPSEGEAQAAFMVREGDGWAVVSQDYDSLLYGAPFVVQNLSITGRRKLPGKFAYITVHPELIDLEANLSMLGISLEQLKIIAILVGTDYNIGGVKGIGPKKALALVKDLKTAEAVFEKAGLEETVWRPILDTFNNMPVTDKFELKWGVVDKEKVKQLLVDKFDFSQDRVESTLNKFKKNAQKGLGEFL